MTALLGTGRLALLNDPLNGRWGFGSTVGRKLVGVGFSAVFCNRCGQTGQTESSLLPLHSDNSSITKGAPPAASVPDPGPKVSSEQAGLGSCHRGFLTSSLIHPVV